MCIVLVSGFAVPLRSLLCTGLSARVKCVCMCVCVCVR